MEDGRRRRRTHSSAFKAEAVAACRKPGASIAAAAMERSVNANLLRRWVVEAELAEAETLPTPKALPSSGESFIALPIAAKSADPQTDPNQSAARKPDGERAMAEFGDARVRCLATRSTEVIRIDAAWFAVEPLDMRAGVDTALARVVSVFGEARAHHAYLFVNKRANRMKVLVHDGFGLWLCARRLYEGGFIRGCVFHVIVNRFSTGW